MAKISKKYAKGSEPKKTKSKGKRVPYIDINGDIITNLSVWKRQNPGKIYFESSLERDCYIELNKSGFDFEFQPKSRELQESFKTWSFSLKTKKLYKATVRNISYTSDFLVKCPDGTRLYIEAKGFFHKDSRLRYKMFQNSLQPGEMTLLIKSRLDMSKVIEIIKENYCGPNKYDKLKHITI